LATAFKRIEALARARQHGGVASWRSVGVGLRVLGVLCPWATRVWPGVIGCAASVKRFAMATLPQSLQVPSVAASGVPPTLGAAHRRRLRDVWRSAGWPSQDMVEVELLAAGWLERRSDAHGRETLRVTDAGIAVLAGTLQRNRAARDAHEALVEQVALEMSRAGRLAWRGLSLRAPIAAQPPELEPAAVRWVMAMPDVFSIRQTTVEDYVEPIVHEVKVRRADLLADLRQPSKREAYLALGGQCWYVLKAGIAQADEVPRSCGVLVAHGLGGGSVCADGAAAERAVRLEVARPAPRRPMRLSLSTWMALARATPLPPLDPDGQGLL
jgi:hypothetical protein